MKKEILHTKNLVKHYYLDGVIVKAINGVTFSIPRNKMTVIIGPSGCGKSTLLHLIGLLDKPTRGKIYFDGYDISKLTETKLAKLRLKKIGFVFQFFNLHPLLTAVENVELPLTISNVSLAERRKKALELLKIVGLKERADHYPNQLSGGEQQRVAIARAMSNDPEIIMADEPTGNLDTKSGDDIMRLLIKLREKSTVIVITHDADIARRANKTIKLRDGIIVK
ncbi:MAG: ABC transporter ATP-binding protein [Candidatus Pacearchaeota archaeon]|nr:MAG: ABC transporter ATP-binding protein [Candidatus Pacearchaeota archaeon]